MSRHRLVCIGDSLAQGFMSGAVHRTDLSFPALVSEALGVGESFRMPDFTGAGGLPLNLELLLGTISDRYGAKIDWWQLLPMLWRLRSWMDGVEDYWERGAGAGPDSRHDRPHNLAVWGFEVRDAFTVTESYCRTVIPRPRDHFIKQVPEMPMYRTARRVLNPGLTDTGAERTQLACARELAADGGIENLVLFLGANNVLGTVTSLSIRHSESDDLHRLPHERNANLYRPEHFRLLFEQLADGVETIAAERVFVGTVPHVTIPPVTRGVSPDGGQDAAGHFEFYTRPWVWDDDFDPQRHPHLTREQVQAIDETVNAYNAVIRETAHRRGWHVFDVCALLDGLAFRRSGGAPAGPFPAGLVGALRNHPRLKSLVSDDGGVRLDTRYLCLQADDQTRIVKGGLFSLDGIHPSTIGYSLVADLLVETMRSAGVDAPLALDWEAVVRRDTLVNDPPAMLCNLKATLRFLDRYGLLSAVIRLFG